MDWLTDEQIDRFLNNRRYAVLYANGQLLNGEPLGRERIADDINTLIQDQKDLFDIATERIAKLQAERDTLAERVRQLEAELAEWRSDEKRREWQERD